MPPRPLVFRREAGRRAPRGPLFLGQKVVGELRILMRLASHQPNGGITLPDERSY